VTGVVRLRAAGMCSVGPTRHTITQEMEKDMSERIPRRVLLLIATALAAMSAFAIGTASAGASEVVYSNVPNSLPGNFASVGAEAYAYAEFGGQMELAGTARNKPTIEVVMSTWGCQFGEWFNKGTCETPQPAKKFKWPLTVSLYEVGEKNARGEKLGTVTKSFAMPYRPSDDLAHCPSGEQWYDAASATCFHGFAFTVKFPPIKVLRIPKHVIVGVSYNTSHYGPVPAGEATACYTKSSGCYYDSLNVGLAEPSENLLTVGKDPAEPYIHIQNSGALPEACGNTALLTEFGPTECNSYWEGDQPLVKITAH
jgi:hypothetical protein